MKNHYLLPLCLLTTAFSAVPAAAQYADHFESRADAIASTSSADTIVTDGYHTAGDGGGATYRKAGTGTASDGSSFNIGTTLYRYVAGPEGIDVRQFGAKCDWASTGQVDITPIRERLNDLQARDAAATDDFVAFQNAIDFAGQLRGTLDVGGGYGAVVHVPSGSCLIGDGTGTFAPLRVKDGVTLKGEGPYSTILVMDYRYPATLNFIELGNDQNIASFGTRLEDLLLFSWRANAGANTAMVYSDNVQHTGGLARVKIYAGNRSAVRFEVGYGGASYVTLEDVEANNFGDKDPYAVLINEDPNDQGPTETEAVNHNNPIIFLDYGEGTFVRAVNLVLQGPFDYADAPAAGYRSDGIGLYIAGGQIEVDGFHSDGLGHPIWVAFDQGYVRLRNLTGGNGCKYLVSLVNGLPADKTVVGMAQPNGCANYKTLKDYRPGGGEVQYAIVEDQKY